MEPMKVTEMTLRGPLEFARRTTDIYAQGAKIYWSFWGPFGLPARLAVETWVQTQREFLKSLEAFVGPD